MLSRRRPASSARAGDEYDNCDEDSEPVELAVEEGCGDAVVVVGAVEDAVHQAGGKQAVAGASEDYSDQWP